MRGWESTAKSPKGEGRFWNVQRHRGVDGSEMELEGYGAGGLNDGAPPGETESIADCEDLSLFCSQSSRNSFQAGEGPRSPGFRPDDGTGSQRTGCYISEAEGKGPGLGKGHNNDEVGSSWRSI